MIEIISGDITQLDIDAIVNAANESLLGGAGVDGAIHQAAGPELLEKCRTLKGCRTGQVKITPGYLLPARHIIHTVGPVYKDGHSGEAELLASCYSKAMQLAIQHGIRQIAFPAISCGVYGYPHAQACRIAVQTVAESLHGQPNMTVYFVCFSESMRAHYQKALHPL